MPVIQGRFELLVQNGYRHWSKQLVEKRLTEDPLVRQYVVHNDDYHFNPNTIAIYNFADNPMFGEYKTVAYSKKNTDWVRLHFFEDFDMQKNSITFKSIKNQYTLSFDNTNPCIHKRISESLQHNDIL